MAKKAERVDEADYLVVGAGSAGCALAGRLAESGASVLLLEAGGRDKSMMFTKPGMIAMIHAEPKLKAKFDWDFYNVPQPHLNGRRIPATRGKLLGGSGSVNGMIYVRGNRADFDDWEAEGNKGWGFADVLPTFQRMETWEGGATAYRGGAGPIQVIENHDITDASAGFVRAGAAALGVPVNPDYNAESQHGMHVIQENTRDAVRYSSSRAYLAEQRATLSVQTAATVTRVVMRGGRAAGVEVLEADGTRRFLHAGKEVILSAGAFGSPHILMLSGVGHSDHLAEHGIGVEADLPVGDSLHDHLFVPTTFRMSNTPHKGTPAYFLRGLVKETLRNGSTFLAHSVFEAGGFVRTSLADAEAPDMQLLALPWAYPSPNQDAPERTPVDKHPALSVFSTLIRPRSRGTVRLVSADPRTAPLIDPNYLAEPADGRVLLEGLQMIREVMAHPEIAPYVQGELHPGREYVGDALEAELLNRATTVYHPVGSCRMGVDERAVVDPALRVRGIEGLRVADASIMPSITGGNTNAPSMMIGEKCAELILQD